MGHAAVANLTAKGRATRARIVRVASEQMLERGVARTTIEDIEKAANVSTSQMYHYFADKDDLVAAVIDLQSSQVLGRQQLALRPLDSIAAMVRWRNAVVDVMRGRGCVGGCPIGSLANELSDTDPLARARLAQRLRTMGGHDPVGADRDRRTGRTTVRVRRKPPGDGRARMRAGRLAAQPAQARHRAVGGGYWTR